MRADARRNRDHIVAAARVLFITNGVDTPMEEIAKRAGVGVGTLYRRFPDRAALMNAVAVDVFGRLANMIATARAEEPRPWDALRRFLRAWAEFRLGLLQDPLCHGMPEALQADARLREIRARWLDQLGETIREAQQAGDVRADVGIEEIATFMNMLIRAEPSPTTDRVLDVMLAGLASQVTATPTR